MLTANAFIKMFYVSSI